MIYSVKGSPAQSQYRGCGKAWVATNKNAEIVGIRYMHDFEPDLTKLPKWVQAIRESYPTIRQWDGNYSRRFCPDAARLGKLKKIAVANGYPEAGPKGGYIKASTIVLDAKTQIVEAESNQFGEYRLKCRRELAELGEVSSGMLSCYEFIPKHW